MTPQEEVRAAGDARHILGQPLFLKAKAEVYEKLRQARSKLAISPDPQAAMDLIRTEQVADMFFEHFEMVLQTGQLAAQHLADFDAAQMKKQSGLRLFHMFGRNGI